MPGLGPACSGKAVAELASPLSTTSIIPSPQKNKLLFLFFSISIFLCSLLVPSFGLIQAPRVPIPTFSDPSASTRLTCCSDLAIPSPLAVVMVATRPHEANVSDTSWTKMSAAVSRSAQIFRPLPKLEYSPCKSLIFCHLLSSSSSSYSSTHLRVSQHEPGVLG